MNKTNKTTEIKVGITVLIGILLFIFVIMWAKNFSFGSDTQIVKVRFPNVSGLYVKDKVTVNGVERGFVNNLKIDGNSVIATLTLSRDVDLRKDASFSIVMLDLMGGKKVEIKPGISSAKLNLSKIQNGEFKGDISEAMAMFNEMQEDLASIIRSTEKLTKNLNSLLGKKNWGDEISVTMEKINNTLDKTNRLLDENSHQINLIVQNTAELSDSAKSFFENNSSELNYIIHSSKKTIAKADSVFSMMNKMLGSVENSDNNLGKIINDKQYLEKIDSTLNGLNELIKILTRQLKGEGVNVKTNIF